MSIAASLAYASLSRASLSSAHRGFEAALPAIDRTLRYLFRRWPRDRRDEAIADARAAAWHAYYHLLRRGKNPVSVGVTGIAANAARYARNGRQLGCGKPGHAGDVMDPRVRRRHGLRLVSLDDAPGAASGSWHEWLAEDNRVRPSDEACFRVDFAAWLGSMPTRNRQVAELLMEGHQGIVVAERAGVTPGRVSQLRPILEASWRAFQGGALVP
jgi:hypothetical protein